MRLGRCYQEEFSVTDDLADINTAIACMEEVVTSYPKDQKLPAKVSNSLGCMFGDRFRKEGKVKDVDKAIQHTRTAWDTLLSGDPDFGQFSDDLGSLFGDRFEVLETIHLLRRP